MKRLLVLIFIFLPSICFATTFTQIITLTLGSSKTGNAANIRSTCTDAGGTSRSISPTWTENLDGFGNADTGTYRATITVDTAWQFPLEIDNTITVVTNLSVPIVLYSDREAEITDGLTATTIADIPSTYTQTTAANQQLNGIAVQNTAAPGSVVTNSPYALLLGISNGITLLPSGSANAAAVWGAATRTLTAQSDTSGTTTLLTRIAHTLNFDGSNNLEAYVAGYESAQDPETLVLGATASSWNTSGTIGAAINTAATGSGLTAATIWTYGTRTLTAQSDTPGTTTLLGRVPQTLLFDVSGNIKANAETVSDKTGYSLTTTPPTLGQIEAGILVTPGQPIATNSSNQVISSSVQGNVTGSVGSVTNAVSVGSYSAGEAPDYLTWNALLSTYDTLNTFGNFVQNISGGGSTPAQIWAYSGTRSLTVPPPTTAQIAAAILLNPLYLLETDSSGRVTPIPSTPIGGGR